MSVKLADKKDNKPSSWDTQSIVVIAILLIFLLGIIYVIYSSFSSGIKEQKEKEQQIAVKYERQAPNYTTLEASETAEQKTTATEGVIGLEQFSQQMVRDNTQFFDSIRDIIGDKVYAELIDSMGTEYFHQSAIHNYEDLHLQIDKMLVNAGYINNLYNHYILNGEDMALFDGCVGGEECDMKQFISTYTTGELNKFLMESHEKWESLIYCEKNKQEITNDYLNLFYQDEVCSSLDYISKFDVSFIVLNSEQFKLEFSELQEAYEKGYIPVTRICNYGDIDGAIPVKTALDNIQLYKDIDFYDEGEFTTLTSNTIQNLFLEKEIGDMKYLGGTELATDSNALKQAIKGAVKEAPNPEEIGTNPADYDYSQIQYWNLQQFSLCDRNEDDALYILWKINRLEHTKEIPALSSIKDELTEKAKIYQARKKVSATVFAEREELTDEEVNELVEQEFSGHVTDDSNAQEVSEETTSIQEN